MNQKRILGFSLAEALITLLIVSLITLASVPVITKKKRVKVSPTGSWFCTLNEAGQHVSYSSQTGAWRIEGNECTFYPPRDTRNFEVIAVGGGGGGASGYSKSEKIFLTGNGTAAKTFTTEASGDYELTLIGGGGQGGKRQNNANRCKENPGGPGGSGGFINRIVSLENNTTYNLRAGTGGSTGGYGGADGGSSYISTGSTQVAIATGGGGGGGRWGAACGKGSEDYEDDHWGARGSAGSPSGVTGKFEVNITNDNEVRTTGGILCNAGSTATNVASKKYLKSTRVAGMDCNKLLTDENYLAQTEAMQFPSGSGYSSFNVYGLPYGYGGKGHDSNGERGNGGPGVLILRYNIVMAGGGGQSATPQRPAVIPQIKKLVARVGVGGAGATATNSAGGNGSRTEYLIQTQDRELSNFANGGSGGQVRADSKATATESGTIAGITGIASEVKNFKSTATGGAGGYTWSNSSADGLTPPYLKKDYFGSGGGGGGASAGVWGKGGNGAPGAVLVSW